MSAQQFQERCEAAEVSLTASSRKVQETATNAHQDVTTRVEQALRSLLPVVAKVHMFYEEGTQLDDEHKKIMQAMKLSFGAAEEAAATRYNEFTKLLESVATLRSLSIAPLIRDINALGEQARKDIISGEKSASDLATEISEGEVQYARSQAVVSECEWAIDHPVLDVAVAISSPFLWMADRIAGGGTDLTKTRESLTEARNLLQRIRDGNITTRRKIEENEASLAQAKQMRNTATTLLEQIEPLETRAERLRSKTDKFRAALIDIKAKAVSLNMEASDVAVCASLASDSSTTRKSYSKQDFAFGLLSICREALFDFVTKDEVDMILTELVRVWTVNGSNTMPTRLKSMYEQVQAITTNLKAGNDQSAWNQAVNQANITSLDFLQGQRVKGNGPNDTAVYLVLDQELRHIESPKVANTLLGSDWGVKSLSSTFIQGLPKGRPLKEDSRLIVNSHPGAIYLVDNGSKRWITGPAAFNKHGFKWDLVQSIGDGVNNYPDGPNVDLDMRPYEGQRVKGTSDAIFLALEGKLRHIGNMAVYNGLFGPSTRMLKEAQDVIDGMPRGAALIAEPPLVTGTGGGIYLVDEDKKRWIANPETFNGYGFDWGRVVTVDLSKYEDGSMIKV